MAAVTICSDFGAQKNKVWHCFHCLPTYLPQSNGKRCHNLHFFECWALHVFSLPSFTFIKRFFRSSPIFAVRVVSFACLRLLIFLLAILIPTCASSSQAFSVMYSASNLNKHGGNIQPWHIPFLICKQSALWWLVLMVAFDLHIDFSGGR